MSGSVGAIALGLGEGLKNVPGIQGWYRQATADFIRHVDDEGLENEAVGVFLIEPVDIVHTPDPAMEAIRHDVVWKARYLALENELIAAGEGKRRFLVGPEQLEKVWKEAELRQDEFFQAVTDHFGADFHVSGMRYNPLMGLGHSHPGGSTSVSGEDLDVFSDWRGMRASIDREKPGRLQAHGHFILAIGGLVDKLVLLDENGARTGLIEGNLRAAVQ